MNDKELRLELIKALVDVQGLQVNQVVQVAKTYESYIIGDNSDKVSQDAPVDTPKVERKGQRSRPRKSPE